MANEVMQNHQLLSPFSSEFCVSLREDVIKLSPWQNFFITYTGYRLAFNYLKAKRLVDAIDVCHKVYTSLISFCIDVSQLLFPLSDNGWYISTTDSRVMSHTSQGQLSCPWKSTTDPGGEVLSFKKDEVLVWTKGPQRELIRYFLGYRAEKIWQEMGDSEVRLEL